jgi:hypothetical protein
MSRDNLKERPSTFVSQPNLPGQQCYTFLPDFQHHDPIDAEDLLIPLLPLGFFALQMADAKRAALREYGSLAAQYTGEFRQKWLRTTQPSRNELLGSGDIQSRADLGNSYAVVYEMRLLPFGRNLVLRMLILIALPLAPLALTMVPFEVLVQQLIKVVLP